jgi:NAD(P)-dependent dehydrogenase (short-subunit alcohol dehydrogenase family)
MNIFVTGANRGLGLEFVRQYLDDGARVFAAARATSPALQALAQQHPRALTVLTLDVSSDDDIAAAAAAVDVGSLDVVINNAAVNKKGMGLGSYRREGMLEAFAVNAVAPVLVAQALWPLLAKGARPRLVNIGTQVGSFATNSGGSSPLYAASKAALHMYTRALAREGNGVITIVVHPGWVQTDMGGKSAPLTPSQSVSSLRALIDRLQPADNGQFFNVDGKPHPW